MTFGAKASRVVAGRDFLPVEKPRVKGCKVAAAGAREGWMQPRAASYFLTLGMALPQLLWASGSSSVKWGDPCPPPPLCRVLQGARREGDGRERVSDPVGGLELDPPRVIHNGQFLQPVREWGGVVSWDQGQAGALETGQTLPACILSCDPDSPLYPGILGSILEGRDALPGDSVTLFWRWDWTEFQARSGQAWG